MQKKFEFQIDERFHRRRLDEFLFNEFESLSKAYIRRVVKEEKCEVNGYIANRGMKIKTNDFVEIEINIKQQKGMKAEEIPLEIVFEDREIIIINKPCGMLAHPTHYERNGTLLNGLTHYLNHNKNHQYFVRPHLIHRLDRETSGLILIAKNPKASGILSGHFKRKLFEKKYLALVEGVVEDDFGEITANLGRDEIAKKWMVKENGKSAHSKYRVLERFEDKTLLELEPVTGRTNQLRIHCDFIGHPIIGDDLHNGREFYRLCLHASKLSFWHPKGDERMEFVCPIDF